METLVSFLRGYDTLSLRKISGQHVTMVQDGFDTELDFQHLREKCLEELMVDIAVFLEPKTPNFDPAPLVGLLPKLGFGVFTIATLIPKLVLEGFMEARTKLRNYYYNVFGAETIQTIQGFIKANLNQSVAAKTMYMHRNTLNYRIDHFIALAEIDVKSFSGAYAFHLLFSA